VAWTEAAGFALALTPMPLLPLLFLLLAGAVSAAAPGPARPNIVVILADDLGYGDPSCYNPERGRIATPHLDRLAREGARFTDGHASSAACSPSRYTLLTGRYHWRTRLQSGIVDLWERPLIAPDRLTIAGLARRQGYRTAAFGKWHLGWDWPLEPGDLAALRGLGGRAGRSREPLVTEPTAEHRRVWSRVFSEPIAGGPITRGFEHYFGTDVPNWPPYSFIVDDRTLGVPSTLLPARLLEGFRASFQGPSLPGWEFEPVLDTTIARAEAYVAERARSAEPFLLYVALTTPHTPISPSRAWQGRSGLNDYADLVMETDDAIGRLLAALDRHGLARDTFVLCTSDNGYESAIGIKPLEALGHFPSGPLRGYKRDAWEGGHRVPFLVRWPRVVPAGQISGALVHQADLMATLADIWGATLPVDAGEDSFSLLPLWRDGRAEIRPHAVSCGVNGLQAVREGPWKLLCGRTPRLHHLGEDLAEQHDRAATEPARVQAMLALRERLITEGRSTPGPRRENDVPVRRLPGGG
jgi:arylsulfatase A